MVNCEPPASNINKIKNVIITYIDINFKIRSLL